MNYDLIQDRRPKSPITLHLVSEYRRADGQSVCVEP